LIDICEALCLVIVQMTSGPIYVSWNPSVYTLWYLCDNCPVQDVWPVTCGFVLQQKREMCPSPKVIKPQLMGWNENNVVIYYSTLPCLAWIDFV